MNKKILLTSIALITISIGGFLIYFFLVLVANNDPTVPSGVPESVRPIEKELPKMEEPAADTTNWKLYQNKQYGYELKYPANWEIGTTFNADPATFSAPSFSLPNCLENDSGVCPDFMIGNIHKVEPGETIKRDISFDANDKIIAEKNIKISGKDASFIEYYQASYGRRDGSMGLVRQEMKVIHNGVLYRIYISEIEYPSKTNGIKTSADWKYRKTFEAMLKSFRFLEDSDVLPTVNTASGVLYTNKEFGFSVLLPLGWEKYQVSVQKDKGDDKHTYIYFLMPTTDKNASAYDKNTGKLIAGLTDIFAITATDLDTWNHDANSKECKENPTPDCLEIGNVVGKNSQYVFSASYGNGIIPKDAQKFVEEGSAAKFLSGKFNLQ